MKRLLILIALLTAPAVCQAQQVMDGSDKEVPTDVWASAKSAMSEKLRDPYGAQYDRLSMIDKDHSRICGRVNPKNNSGGYDGFRPFEFDLSAHRLVLNESNKCGSALVDEADLAGIEESCEKTMAEATQYMRGAPTAQGLDERRPKMEWCQRWLEKRLSDKLEEMSK